MLPLTVCCSLVRWRVDEINSAAPHCVLCLVCCSAVWSLVRWRVDEINSAAPHCVL